MKFGHTWPMVSDEKSFEFVVGRRQTTEPAFNILSNNRNLTVVNLSVFRNTNNFRNLRFTPLFCALKLVNYFFLSILVKN